MAISGNIPNFNLPDLGDFYCAYNQLSGSIPDLNCPKLADFRTNNNKISGLAQFTKMPTLTSNTWFEDSLTLYSNKLTFDDILPNITLINSMNGRAKYAPQDSIYSDTLITRSAGQSLTIDLGIDAGLTSNVYVWTKNGAPYTPPVPNTSNSNKLIFNSLNNNDAGDYYVKVTNPNAPQLTLFSRKITIQVTSGCRTADSLALVQLYNATNGPNWTNKWNLAQPMDTWQGVKLNTSGCVKEITLTNNNLVGTLPAALGDLQSLAILWLDDNKMSGPVPNFTAATLQSLNLSINNFSGSIPDFNLPNLEDLALNSNQLSGAIPNFNLPKLKYMFLYNNQLSGAIPNFSFPNLEDLFVANNQLSGLIPNFNLPNLKNLLLHSNKFTGNIPNFNLPNLTKLELEVNQLTGIALAFDKLPNLKYLNIAENDLDSMSVQNTFISSGQSFLTLIFQGNRFTFDDLRRNIQGINFGGIPSNRSYAPQDSAGTVQTLVGNAGQALTIDLGFDKNEPENVYNWFKDGQAYKTINGAPYLSFSALQAQDTGIYHAKVTNTLLPNLTLVTRPIRVSVGCAAMASISGTATFCPGGSTTLTATGGVSFLWSTGVTSTQITVNTAGSYTVTVTAAGGCTGTATQNVAQSNTATASISGTLTFCPGSGTVLTASGGTGFLWSTGATTAQTTVSVAGAYTVTVTAAGGCTGTATRNVAQSNTATASISGALTFCPGSGTVLTASGGTGFLWSTGATTAQVNVNVAGTYSVTVTTTDGCEATGKAEIAESDAVTVSIKSPGILQGGASAALVATVSGAQGDVRYQWEGPDLSCADCAEPKISPRFNASYALTVTDEKGCTAVANVLVAVKSDLGPDVITPGNQDGQNDELIFDDLNNEPAKSQNDITIFNRWGQKVFTARPYLNDWKGTDDKGRELPEGTYYYVLNLRDGIKNAVHGSVLIVR